MTLQAVVGVSEARKTNVVNLLSSHNELSAADLALLSLQRTLPGRVVSDVLDSLRGEFGLVSAALNVTNLTTVYVPPEEDPSATAGRRLQQGHEAPERRLQDAVRPTAGPGDDGFCNSTESRVVVEWTVLYEPEEGESSATSVVETIVPILQALTI